MAITKTISATLSGYQNATGTKSGTASGSWSGSASTSSTLTWTSSDAPSTSDYPSVTSALKSEAAGNISAPSASNYRSAAGSWYLTNGTTSSYTGELIGNTYSSESSSIVASSITYSTSYKTAQWVTANKVTLTTVCTATATKATIKSARTSYDRILTFAVSPSAIDSATITLTHASASSFPAYIAIAASTTETNTFLTSLSSATYQSITLNGTSTTVTLSSAMLTKLKNLGGDTVVINLGKYYADGSVKSSYAGTLSVTAASMTYTLSTVTLSYNANGGSGAPSSATVTPDTSYTLSTTVPTRTGYTFNGWSTSRTAASGTYQAGDSIIVSGDTTLYAVWTANTYTVTYNAKSGTWANGATTSQTVTYGQTWTTLSNSELTRTGYTFQGWSSSSSATSVTHNANTAQSKWTSTSNLTLYAVWTINIYTVAYKPGTYSNETTTYSATKTHGTALTLRDTTYTRYSYTQEGWSTGTAGTSKEYNLLGSYTTNAAATLYPYWTENPTHTVTLDANGGFVSTTSFTVHEGGLYGESFDNNTLPTPTNANSAKSFQGWYTPDGFKVSSNSIFNYTENITLTARWDEIPVVIVCVKNGVTYLITSKDESCALTM